MARHCSACKAPTEAPFGGPWRRPPALHLPAGALPGVHHSAAPAGSSAPTTFRPSEFRMLKVEAAEGCGRRGAEVNAPEIGPVAGAAGPLRPHAFLPRGGSRTPPLAPPPAPHPAHRHFPASLSPPPPHTHTPPPPPRPRHTHTPCQSPPRARLAREAPPPGARAAAAVARRSRAPTGLWGSVSVCVVVGEGAFAPWLEA